MPRHALTTPELAPPVGPYSVAIRHHGELWSSGQLGLDPKTGALVLGGISAQTEQVFRNLAAILAADGKTFDDVVKVSVFLTDMSTFADMNAVYARYFTPPYPARSTIAVTALPLGAAVEIDLVAA